MKKLFVAAFAVICAACGSSSSTPAAPSSSTPATTQTRIIGLNGALGFGTVAVGSRASAVVTVSNLGNSTLTITGLTGPNADVFTASPITGTVPAGGTLQITVFCAPKAQVVYSGTVTINGDQTSGVNTLPISCGGSLAGTPLFTQSGTGDNVFTIPASVTKVRVDATYSGSCQNFIVKSGTSLLINIILGTCSVADTRSPFSGTYAITNGSISITGSTGVSWTFTEVR